jgi:hypothetical protein
MQEKRWKKLGLIYNVDNNHEKLLTHSSNPLAVHLQDDVYRIYYSGRDAQNRSSVSYVDIDIVKNKVIYDHKKPIIEPKENSFYSHGITIGNYWIENGEMYIGFMGWQQKDGEHWRGDIGKFNLQTKEVSLLLGTNEEDKVSLSYPHVMKEGELYTMWYGSTISWTSSNGEMVHVIKSAISKDLTNWEYNGLCIPYEIGKAQAFSKPTVYKTDEGYSMWFSYRDGLGTPYRIGYAYSSDGSKWTMKQSNLNVSLDEWDNNMVCYPYVFEHKQKLYMLYNGNSYGRNGFGLAVAEDDIIN